MSARSFCECTERRGSSPEWRASLCNFAVPALWNSSVIKMGWRTPILDCSQSPIFPWDHRVRRAAILVSWCERNLGEYKILVGSGGEVKRWEWRGGKYIIPAARRALHHPHPRAFCTLSSFTRIKRPRWQPVELNDRHLRSHGKIGDCEQSMPRFNTTGKHSIRYIGPKLYGIWYPKNMRDLPVLSVFRQRIRKLNLNSLPADARCFDCILCRTWYTF